MMTFLVKLSNNSVLRVFCLFIVISVYFLDFIQKHLKKGGGIFMIALIQRVTHANVNVNNQSIGKINAGLLLLLGVEKLDSQKNADELLHKVINYRVFSDNEGKMNLSLLDIQGELLIVPQFTLPANTQKGMRPSFASAAPPDIGKELYEYFIECANKAVQIVNTGEFGADMQVTLTNDGPVTFWLSK